MRYITHQYIKCNASSANFGTLVLLMIKLWMYQIATDGYNLQKVASCGAFEAANFGSFESCQKWQKVGLSKPAKNGLWTYLISD